MWATIWRIYPKRIGIDADKILKYTPKGVRGFVLGTTPLFGKGKPYGETLKNIRELKF